MLPRDMYDSLDKPRKALSLDCACLSESNLNLLLHSWHLQLKSCGFSIRSPFDNNICTISVRLYCEASIIGVISGENCASSELGICQNESVAPLKNFFSLNTLYCGCRRIHSAICVCPKEIASNNASLSFWLSVLDNNA